MTSRKSKKPPSEAKRGKGTKGSWAMKGEKDEENMDDEVEGEQIEQKEPRCSSRHGSKGESNS